jgi:hypothetical protein
MAVEFEQIEALLFVEGHDALMGIDPKTPRGDYRDRDMFHGESSFLTI